MRTLMLSTALVTASAVGAMAQDTTGTMAQDSSTVPAFLSSDFTGMTLYTLDSEDARALRDTTGADGMAGIERDRIRWTSSDTFASERQNWSNVGSVNDIVMTKDGEFRGILVDVGGFLGLGARTVLVDFEDLYFVSEGGETDSIDDFSVVIAMSEDELENLPEWDDAQLTAGFEPHDYRAGGATSPAMETEAAEMETDTAVSGEIVTGEGMEPSTATGTDSGTDMAVFSDGYEMLDTEARTADRLIGADVYDTNGENIGSVQDVVLGSGNDVDGILVDVGGFLGLGAHTVNLPIDDAQIGWNQSDGDVRVMVSMTGSELETMPEHDG